MSLQEVLEEVWTSSQLFSYRNSYLYCESSTNTHDELPVHVSYIVNCFLSIHNIGSYAGTWVDGTACNEFSQHGVKFK